MKLLPNGFYQAMVDSVWEQEGSFGPRWRWNFHIMHAGQTYRVTGFTSANLWNEKTRSYLEAVLDRSVDPREEFFASYLGGERCTVEIGTIQKNGRVFNAIERVI
jgi:hypothetical protein